MITFVYDLRVVEVVYIEVPREYNIIIEFGGGRVYCCRSVCVFSEFCLCGPCIPHESIIYYNREPVY